MHLSHWYAVGVSEDTAELQSWSFLLHSMLCILPFLARGGLLPAGMQNIAPSDCGGRYKGYTVTRP